MDFRLIDLNQISEKQLERLAALHHSVMHTLLSQLGLPVVFRYYQLARLQPDVIGICAISNDGEILGWAIGSPSPDRINTKLRSPLPWFLTQMLKLLLTRPRVLWQLMQSVFADPQAAQVKSGAIELTYIGVAQERQGQGVGEKLLSAFIEASRTRAYRSVVLSVETDNHPALSLYEKAGFKIIRSFSEGQFERHRMERTLV
jgi:ribosomal protein S18 acetylase RimI-like enzyme